MLQIARCARHELFLQRCNDSASTLASTPMAMSDTGSSLAQWSSGLYHYEASSLGHADGGAATTTTDSTAVVVTSAPAAAAVTSPTSAGSGGGGSSSPTRTPRVSKPGSARKRSRASRRAPVTLLNTDTANFRAMVQQFTGIPEPNPFAGPGSGGGAPVINFAADYGFPPPSSVMSFDHLHQQRQQQTFQDQLLRPQQQNHHQHQHQHQQYTGVAFGYSSNMQQAFANGADVFAHGLGSAEDRMLLQSMQAAQQIMPAASITANHSANGFFA